MAPPSGRPRSNKRSSLSPAQRSLRVRIAAYTLHVTRNSREITAAARDAKWHRYLYEVDPDQELDTAERDRSAIAARRARMSPLQRERPLGAGNRFGMGDILALPTNGHRGRVRDLNETDPVDSWLAALGAGTARAYRADLGSLLASRGLEPLEAGRVDLGALVGRLRSQSHAKTTIRARLAGASVLYGWLLACGMLANFPASGLSRPKGGPYLHRAVQPA